MNIYTLSSATTKYLPIQIYLLKKYIKDCEIKVVVGPFNGSDRPVYPIRNDDVEFILLPGETQTRIGKRSLFINYLSNNYILEDDKDSIIMDGDIFPIKDLDVEDLIIPKGIRNYISNRFFSISKEVERVSFIKEGYVDTDATQFVTLKSDFSLIPKEFETVRERIKEEEGTNGGNVEYFEPGFLHMKDMSFVTENNPQAAKYEALLKVAKSHGYNGEYQNLLSDNPDDLKEYMGEKSYLELVSRYSSEIMNWTKFGRPLRSPERVEEIFNICEACPFYKKISEGAGACLSCGCRLKSSVSLGINNKIAMATTACPEGYWSVEPEYEAIKETAKKKSCVKKIRGKKK
jgi:hypothetical protein